MPSGEDVLDGLKQQPSIRSTIQDFQFNYGLPQDLPDVAVGETDKPQHVLVIAEKGTRAPDVISSIPYYIPQPSDGKWEMDLTILKSDTDLSGIEPTKGLNHKKSLLMAGLSFQLTGLLSPLTTHFEILESRAWMLMASQLLTAASTFSSNCEGSNLSFMPLAV
jgi:hypothetical protein